jgi:hypothetical protein
MGTVSTASTTTADATTAAAAAAAAASDAVKYLVHGDALYSTCSSSAVFSVGFSDRAEFTFATLLMADCSFTHS